MNCHRKWERGVNADDLYDFHMNMAYIKRVDEEYYHIREQKLEKNLSQFKEFLWLLKG